MTEAESVFPDAPEAGVGSPSPHKLYEQTGGGDKYRVAMLEAGYVLVAAPWERKQVSGKRVLQCGLVHVFDWSLWYRYEYGGREYLGRFCRTCATTQAREMPLAVLPEETP